jgi:hypothetical protein
MAQVRAKFRCIEKADRASQYGAPGGATAACVSFAPVSGPENKPWSQYTPSGAIQMQIDNPAAVAAFEVGKDYFVDFSAAAEESKAEAVPA